MANQPSDSKALLKSIEGLLKESERLRKKSEKNAREAKRIGEMALELEKIVAERAEREKKQR